MRKILFRKFMSLFLVLLMVLNFLSLNTFNVKAAENTVSFQETDFFPGDLSFNKAIEGISFTFYNGSSVSSPNWLAIDNYLGNIGIYSGSSRNNYNGIDFTVSIRNGYTFDLKGFKHIGSEYDYQVSVYYNGDTNTQVDYNLQSKDVLLTKSNLTIFNDVTSVTFTSDTFVIFQDLVIDDIKLIPPSTPDLNTASDSGSSSSDNITNDTTPTFSGTAAAGSTVVLYDTDGTTMLGTGTTDGTGNWSITTVLSSGTHTITAKATDLAGHTSNASSGLVVTIDTVQPSAPSTPDLNAASDSGSSSSDNITNDTTPTFSGTAEANSTVVLYDTDVATVLGTADSSGNWSITTALSSGTHTITAKAKDLAGNTSNASSGLVVTIDTVQPSAPSTPDLNAASDSGSSSSDNITNDTTPTFSGTAEAGSTVVLYDTDGTTVLGTGTADSSGNWSITTPALSSGAHTITAKAIDAVNNTSQASTGLEVTIDKVIPTIPIATMTSSNANNTKAKVGDVITLNINVSENILNPTATIAGHSAIIGNAGDEDARTWKATYTMQESDNTGVIPFTFDFIDIAGNFGTQVTTVTSGSSVTFDKTAPNLTPGVVSRTGETIGTVKFISDEVGSYYYAIVEDGDTEPVINTGGAGTNFTTNETTIIDPSGLTAGAKDIYIKVKDLVGNVSNAIKINIPAYIAPDEIAPTLQSAVRDSNTQITVALSEAAQNLTKANSGGFTVFETGNPAKTYAVSATAQGTDASHVVLTVADLGASAAKGLTVLYTAGDNGTIQDLAGNALATDGTGVTITAWDTIAPTVSSINRETPAGAITNATSVTYKVTFSEAVTGVDISDFTLATTGTASGSIASVAGSGTTFDVTVNVITGVGTLRLDLNSTGTGIADIGGMTIGTGYTGGQTYAVDTTAPIVTPGVATRNSDTTGTIKFTSNEVCEYYYIIVENDALAPMMDTSGVGTACTTSETILTNPTGLTAGAKDIYIKVKDAAGNVSDAIKIDIAAYVAPSSGGGGNSSTPTQNSTPTTTQGNTTVIVNGKEESIGKSETMTMNNQTQTIILIDETKLQEKLEAVGDNATVTVLGTNTQADIIVTQLNGQMVKTLEDKRATVVVQTPIASYTLPANQINIDAISQQLGQNINLQDIKINIEIAKPKDEVIKVVENAANRGEFSLVVPPVDFKVTYTSGNQTGEVSRFNAYVERTIAIPDGIDPSKITTGIVVNPDGTSYHVPTQVVQIDGKYYAKINSLTNSTYSVIWNKKQFKDVANHWAKDSINNLGSRMVINGVTKDTFQPNQDITRAQFAAIMVRALGLKPGTGDKSYSDVGQDAWFTGYIKTATEYNLIKGYENGKFGPNDKITRQQAIAIIARAMTLTNLNTDLQDNEVNTILEKYRDSKQIADYAKENIALAIQMGIVNGRSNQTVAPRDFITRAEVATIVEHLLKKSELID